MPFTTAKHGAKSPENPLLSGVGLTLLLLAASPLRDVVGTSVSDGGFRCFYGQDTQWSATPMLHYFAAATESSQEHLAPGRSEFVSDDASDEDNESRRRRRARRSNQPKSDVGAGDAMSTTEAESSMQIISEEAASVYNDFEPEGLARLDDQTMELILSYLTLPELSTCRRVRRRWFDFVNSVAPLSASGAVFIRYKHDTNRGTFATLPRSLTRWQCPDCRRSQSVGASCAHCGRQNDDPSALRRLFLGQLRKERTVEITDWLIAVVKPGLKLVHLENHTNPKDGRGKGCVWAFVESAGEEAAILSLNKRLFMDVDEAGNEGFWFVPPGQTPELAEFAQTQAYIPHRPLTLPRQPFVAERPAGARPQQAKSSHVSVPRQACPAFGSGPFLTHATAKPQPPSCQGVYRHNPYSWDQSYDAA